MSKGRGVKKKEQIERRAASMNQCGAEGSMQWGGYIYQGQRRVDRRGCGDVAMAFPRFYLDVRHGLCTDGGGFPCSAA